MMAASLDFLLGLEILFSNKVPCPEVLLLLLLSLQSCLTLCDPIDGSPPGSPIPGILQAILGKHKFWGHFNPLRQI